MLEFFILNVICKSNAGFPLAIAIVANGDKLETMALTFQIWRFSNHPTEI